MYAFALPGKNIFYVTYFCIKCDIYISITKSVGQSIKHCCLVSYVLVGMEQTLVCTGHRRAGMLP